jgi:hypothetical protein
MCNFVPHSLVALGSKPKAAAANSKVALDRTKAGAKPEDNVEDAEMQRLRQLAAAKQSKGTPCKSHFCLSILALHPGALSSMRCLSVSLRHVLRSYWYHRSALRRLSDMHL